ncbi:MAG: PepSY-associated TM helix domain-containing protein [Byssovorax sp.]
MKLSKHAFKALWDVHAWLGVTAGLFLYIICFTGIFLAYRDELDVWQDPALRVPAGQMRPLSEIVDPVLRSGRLDPRAIEIYLPTEQRHTVDVRYREPGGVGRHMLHIDPRTGEALPDRSRLAALLFYLHFFYHERWFSQGILLAGLLGAAMFLGLLTGFVLHYRNIASQLHRFRPRDRSMVGWADAHKILAVFGLPFQTMAAFTGTMICLGPLLLRLFVAPVFHGDMKSAEKSLYGTFTGPTAAGERAPSLEVDTLVARALETVPGLALTQLRIHHYGDAAGTLTVYGKLAEAPFSTASVRVRLRDGVVSHAETPSTLQPGHTVERWVRSLHFADFGGSAVKICYALSALAACLTILTGNWIWLFRRESAGASLGNRVLARLTVGTGAGLCLATGALFVVNRCIPMDASGRMTVESAVFFGMWAFTFAWSSVRRCARRSWTELLALSGLLFVLAPLLDTFTTNVHRLEVRAQGRWDMAGINLALLLFGGALLGAAWRIHAARGRAPEGDRGVLHHA